MTDVETSTTDEGPVRFMQHVVSLEYAVAVSPVARRFGEHLRSGRVVGRKCPSCGLVYVPPRGFCPLCVVATTEEHETEVADRGTVTSFTVLTPIQYYGQKEREDYVLASVLLDGADSTVGQQRIGGLPTDEVRLGLRVQAVWAPEEDRKADGRGFGSAVNEWNPTGEPDLPRSAFAEHVL